MPVCLRIYQLVDHYGNGIYAKNYVFTSFKENLIVRQVHDKVLENQLRALGLRPTKQRLALASMIFSGNDRHLCAEELYEEALDSQLDVSLATIYNTLRQFTDVGLLRVIAIEGSRTWFDTNTSDHHHFYDDYANEIIDIPAETADKPLITNLPTPPEGMEISHIDMIIRIRPKRGTQR